MQIGRIYYYKIKMRDTQSMYEALLQAIDRKVRMTLRQREMFSSKEEYYKLKYHALEWAVENFLCYSPDTPELVESIREQVQHTHDETFANNVRGYE